MHPRFSSLNRPSTPFFFSLPKALKTLKYRDFPLDTGLFACYSSSVSRTGEVSIVCLHTTSGPASIFQVVLLSCMQLLQQAADSIVFPRAT